MKRTLARIATAAACLLGAAAAHANTIVVGQVGPLSGLEASQGRAYSYGMELYFNRVNKSGGVNGHQFTLVRKDDGGRPEDTTALTRELLAESKPLVLSGYFGNRNVDDLIASNVLTQERIPLVGYRSWGIRAEAPYVYSVRAGLNDEIRKVVEHLATIGVTKLGLLHEAGPAAASVVAAVDEAAASAKAQVVLRTSYEPGSAKVGAAVAQFMRAQPQAVILVTSGGTAAAFIDQYRAAGGTAQIFTHSGADVEQLAKRLGEDQLQGVAIAQVTPTPYKISSKLSKELNDLLAAAESTHPPASYAMMEGFIAAKLIVEAVRRQGRSPTREGTVAALDSISNLDLGGYVLGFKPGSRTGSRYVDLTIVGGGRIRQ